MSLFQQAVFLTTVAHLRDLPQDAIREVAFAGRSNSGKSSAINTLAGQTRLAYVSKTPGRTQHLNYFALAEGRYFVDLPGYGYAKAPGEIRAQWEGLIGPYLSKREKLVGLVVIARPIHILLSKADKLSRQGQTTTLRAVKAELATTGVNNPCSVQLFSSLKRTGIEEAEAILAGWLGIEGKTRENKRPPEKGNPEAKIP